MDEILLVEQQLPKQIDVLLANLLDDDEDLRVSAGVGLSGLGRAGIVPLLSVLADPRFRENDDSLWKAIMALDSLVADERIADEGALHRIATALREFAVSYKPRGPDDNAHWKAVESLGPLHIGGQAGISTLADIARRARAPVAQWALNELMWFDNETAELALSSIADSKTARGRQAAKALRHWHKLHEPGDR